MRENKKSFMPQFLFLCIITTSIVTTFSLSKYQSTLTGSTKISRVAVPILNVTCVDNQEQNLKIDCNTNDTSVKYEIIVSNKQNNMISEVSLKYDIILTLPQNVQDGLIVKIDNKIPTKNKNTYIISDIGRFNSGIQNKNKHTLIFEADPDVIRTCNFEDITVTVYAEQID